MGDLRFEYDVEGVEKVMRRIRRGIKEGMEEAAEDLTGRGKESAKDRIFQRGRIWNKEVYSYGWDEDVDSLSPTRVDGTLTNYANHARIVDEGRRPGEAPQIQHIIDWVDDKVIGDWDGGSGDDDGRGGGGGPPTTSVDSHAILRDDVEIDNIQTGVEYGLDLSANSLSIWLIEYENGEKGIFKPYDVGGSHTGAVQNEQLVSRIADYFGWERGIPANAETTIDTRDGPRTGNVQEWVDDAKPYLETVRNSVKIGGIKPSEFVTENHEWVARTGVLDFLIGNDDRHEQNIILDSDNRPHIIDSGGHHVPVRDYTNDGPVEPDLKAQMRLVVQSDYMDFSYKARDEDFRVLDPEQMHAAMNAVLDEQEEIFEALRDPDVRARFIEWAKELHEADDTHWNGRFEALLAEDSSWARAVYKEDANGVPYYQVQINEIRDRLDRELEARQNDDLTDDDVAFDPESSDLLAELDAKLDEALGGI